MNRLLLSVAVVAVLGAAVALSRPKPDAPASSPDFRVATGDKNPWTSLKPNSDPEQFQFAVVSDRTGGHRAKIFSRAVHQINLLQPEFVMSVGDLIEGYTKEEAKAKIGKPPILDDGLCGEADDRVVAMPTGELMKEMRRIFWR